MAQIDRTQSSIEFKHQNISAVLDELGMPGFQATNPGATIRMPFSMRLTVTSAGNLTFLNPP